MIRPYEKGDYLCFEVQEAQINESVYGVCFDKLLCGFSIVHHHQVVGVFGVDVKDDGVAWCYALLSKNCGLCLIELVKFFRRFEDTFCKQFKIKKYVMTVNVLFRQGVRLALMLGFLPKEVLKGFFLNMDYQIYERIK